MYRPSDPHSHDVDIMYISLYVSCISITSYIMTMHHIQNIYLYIWCKYQKVSEYISTGTKHNLVYVYLVYTIAELKPTKCIFQLCSKSQALDTKYTHNRVSMTYSYIFAHTIREYQYVSKYIYPTRYQSMIYHVKTWS